MSACEQALELAGALGRLAFLHDVFEIDREIKGDNSPITDTMISALEKAQATVKEVKDFLLVQEVGKVEL